MGSSMLLRTPISYHPHIVKAGIGTFLFLLGVSNIYNLLPLGVLNRKSDLLNGFPYFLAQLQHKALRGLFSLLQFFYKEYIFEISFS